MATQPPPPGKHEWLIVVPDKPGAHEKRLAVRAKHLEGANAHAASGLYKTGGALLTDVPPAEAVAAKDASKFSFAGSSLVMVAASREEIVEHLSKDIYATSGVWDMDKIQMWPGIFAFRNP